MLKFKIVLHGNLEYKTQIDKPISLSQLVSTYPIITQKEPSTTRLFLNSLMKKNNVAFNPQFNIVSYSLVKDFAKIGMGISYITKEFAKEELQNKELYQIPVIEKIPGRQLGIVTVKSTIDTISTKKLIDIILDK